MGVLKTHPSDVTADPTSERHGELTLADVEWEPINRVLTECDGNLRQAARQLGVPRRPLQRRRAQWLDKH